MHRKRQNRTEIARIARLTLPTCELEFKAFELYELQGYVELVDHAQSAMDQEPALSAEVPMGLCELSEPAVSLQFQVEAC